MSIDYGKPAGSMGGSVTDQPLMNSTPIWETRGKKRRGLGRAARAAEPMVAPERRSFEPGDVDRTYPGPATVEAASIDPIMSDPIMGAPMTREPLRDDVMEETPLSAPIGRARTTTTTRKSGIGPAAVAAGLVALGAVGAAGWYMTRDSDDGVAQMTPGAVSTEVATAPEGLDPATNILPPRIADERPMMSVRAEAPAPLRAAPPPTRVASARVRPGAPSAATTGANASATLPTGPQPYSSTAPSPAETTAVNPTPAPVAATPPAEAAPAETPVPATPPTDTPTPPQ